MHVCLRRSEYVKGTHAALFVHVAMVCIQTVEAENFEGKGIFEEKTDKNVWLC